MGWRLIVEILSLMQAQSWFASAHWLPAKNKGERGWELIILVGWESQLPAQLRLDFSQLCAANQTCKKNFLQKKRIEENFENHGASRTKQRKDWTHQGDEIAGGFSSWSFGENLQLFAESQHPMWSFYGLQKISEDMSRWISGPWHGGTGKAPRHVPNLKSEVLINSFLRKYEF